MKAIIDSSVEFDSRYDVMLAENEVDWRTVGPFVMEDSDIPIDFRSSRAGGKTVDTSTQEGKVEEVAIPSQGTGAEYAAPAVGKVPKHTVRGSVESRPCGSVKGVEPETSLRIDEDFSSVEVWDKVKLAIGEAKSSEGGRGACRNERSEETILLDGLARYRPKKT